MKEKKDYFSYLIGMGGIFLTIVSFFNDESWKTVFLMSGVAGTAVAVIMIYINKYLYQLDNLKREVSRLRAEYTFSEQVRNLRAEVDSIKMGKKGSMNTDIVDFIKVVFLLIIIFLILKAIGVV